MGKPYPGGEELFSEKFDCWMALDEMGGKMLESLFGFDSQLNHVSDQEANIFIDEVLEAIRSNMMKVAQKYDDKFILKG